MSWKDLLYQHLKEQHDVDLLDDDDLNQIQNIVLDGLSQGFEEPMKFKVFDAQHNFKEDASGIKVMQYFIGLDIRQAAILLTTLSRGFVVQTDEYLIVPPPKVKM